MSSRSRSISGEDPISFFISRLAVGQLAPQRRLSSVMRRCLARLLGKLGHLVGVERLFQEIEGADPHRLHRHRHVAMAGDQDHRQRRCPAPSAA
jgi:hypothetical protein